MSLDAVFTGSIMAILRGFEPDETVRLANVAWDLGIDAVEVPIGQPEQVDALVAAVEAGQARGKRVGAGTVITIEQVDAALRASAAYTVAPGFDLEILEASEAVNLPHLPGIATATELQRARNAGCTWVKAFPASSLGTSWFRDIRGPFPDVRIVAAGGLTVETAAQFLAAGATVAAIGSALSDLTQRPAFAALVSAGRAGRGLVGGGSVAERRVDGAEGQGSGQA
jgi:2-dehydro-3-deoxyphosphogluconate aldolase/(4S)-4-hydroxy-2-oxoglutarate aldolase